MKHFVNHIPDEEIAHVAARISLPDARAYLLERGMTLFPVHRRTGKQTKVVHRVFKPEAMGGVDMTDNQLVWHAAKLQIRENMNEQRINAALVEVTQ